jgi:CubicO group peptidase (beta-lactamase class C family)
MTQAKLGLLVSCAAIAVLFACTEQQPEVLQGQGEPELILEQGESAQLSAGDSHTYEMKTGAEQFVTGAIDQESVDVVVSIIGPDDEEVAGFDVSGRGLEHVRFQTVAAGIHKIVVSPFEEEDGTYTVGAFFQQPQATTPEETVDQLMSLYEDDTPGGVVAVTRNGEIVFSKSFGLANVEYGTPNSTSTPWHMASVSKQFTAMAIVLLGQQGLLDIDDDVHNHLPDLADFGHTITLRHLLNHTSGLRDHWNLWAMSGGRMDDVIRQEDIYRLTLRQRDLNFEPGSEFLYSNTGYMLLSEVVSAVAGKPFGEWMKENVFDPLGMDSTQVYDDHMRIVPGRAYSYGDGDDGLVKLVLSYANSGATSLFTTAEDLAKWLSNFKTGQVGGKEAIELLQVQGVLNDGETIDYALGISVSEQNGLHRISHSGGDAGYRTWLGYFPEIDAGVIVLGNKAGFDGGGIGVATADAFFADQMSFGNNADTDQPDEESPAHEIEKWQPSPDDLAGYVGRFYSDELETFYTVKLDDDTLSINHIRHGSSPLEPKERDVFASDMWFVGSVTFSRGDDGSLHGLSMSNGRVRNLVFNKVDE